MKNESTTFTKEQIHSFSRELLEELVFSLIQSQNHLNQQLALLTEQINVLNQEIYGRQTEKSSEIDPQLNCFNDAEIIVAEATKEQLEEPAMEDIHQDTEVFQSVPQKQNSRKKGKREADLSAFKHNEIRHELLPEQRNCECGGTYKQLNEEHAYRLAFHPAYFEVEEHVTVSYRCSKCGTIIRADHPDALFEGSVATPSLLAGIMTAKYANATTFYRLEKSFADSDAHISRQTMARWMVRSVERYFNRIYERMKELLLESRVIHADETTVEVSKDGRKAGSKSYMWVYVNENDDCPIVIYEYQKTRAAAHPQTFLKDYKGILCCDGYEGYHSLNPDILVCGCWAHSRRHFSNAVKALKKEPHRHKELTISEQALQMIAELFHTDNEWKEFPPTERIHNRETILKPKVDQFFQWLEDVRNAVPPKSETGKGITYCLNQKKYLLGFLSTPDAPLDNSEAERKIRNFVISRKNFVLIDTIAGAEASAVLFSLAETIKANGLKSYEYFEYLLTELPKYPKNADIDSLLPWSRDLPARIHRTIET